MDRHVTYLEEERSVYKDLVGKYEGKRSFATPRRIKTDLKETLREGVLNSSGSG
jgi:hypothetical protein